MSDAMCDELACVGELLAAQIDAGQIREDVLECMFRSWMQRLSHATHITTHKAKTLLTQAINTGPWTSDQCRDLAACVLAGKKTASTAARRSNQKAHNFENLLPIAAAIALRDVATFSLTSRLSIVASAARVLGLELPDNKTLYRMVAVVAYYGGEWGMSQEQVWDNMNILQGYMQCSGRKPACEFLSEYPPTSVLLPSDIKVAAYGSEDNLPPEVNIPELDTILGVTKMRGSRKARTQSHSKAQASNTAKSPTTCSDLQLALPSPDLQPLPPAGPLPSAECFRFRKDSTIVPASSTQLCHVCGKTITAHDKDGAAAHKADDDDADGDDDDDEALSYLDDFEQNMLNAYEARKKPAGKDTVDAKNHAKAKAKATAKVKAKATAKVKAKAKPKSKLPAPSSKKLVLGCSKCRFSPRGCEQCKNPRFSGKRACRTAMKKTIK